MITTPRRIVDGKVKPGEPVWLCVLLSDNGAYTGYYAGPNKKHQAFASTFAKCPAAQIYFFLCRHGILQQDVDKFICKNFSMAQLRLVSQAKYNRRTGLATVPVQPGEENILDAARLDNSLVDLTKLTKRDFEEDDKETEEYKGPTKNAPDCYKFDSTQSVTTLNHGTAKILSSGKSVKSVALGESVCSIDTQDDMEEDEENSNAAALALDPLTKLMNEEVQFDLSYIAQEIRSKQRMVQRLMMERRRNQHLHTAILQNQRRQGYWRHSEGALYRTLHLRLRLFDLTWSQLRPSPIKSSSPLLLFSLEKVDHFRRCLTF